jgi:hypothetical protein
VQRALNAAPSAAPLQKALPSLKSLVDAAVAGKADKAARATSDLFDKALVSIADEFATPSKEAR